MPRIPVTFFMLLVALAAPAAAQTDYFNTDAGRPIAVQDALPLERYAFELQFAPLRLQRAAGVSTWAVEPELAYGIFSRTQLELGVPLVWTDAENSVPGAAGLDVGLLYALNVETRTLPAFAVAATMRAPVGPFAPAQPLLALEGIMTRSVPGARLHLNGAFTIGNASSSVATTDDLERWFVGAAVDHTFPLHSLLVTAELVAEGGMAPFDSTQWRTGAGLRWQASPYVALDAGGGVRLGGGGARWQLTAGGALAFALRPLIPVR